MPAQVFPMDQHVFPLMMVVSDEHQVDVLFTIIVWKRRHRIPFAIKYDGLVPQRQVAGVLRVGFNLKGSACSAMMPAAPSYHLPSAVQHNARQGYKNNGEK